MKNFKFVLTAACLTLAATSSQAMNAGLDGVHAVKPALKIDINTDAQAEAKQFVEQMASQGIGFLSNSSLSPAEQQAEFKTLLNQSFDMDVIGRFALGRYWNSATPAQQQEYLKLFNDMIIKVYSRRFSEYNGQKLIVGNAREEGKYDYIVNSEIVPPQGEKIRLDWRVREKNGSFKVVDIIVAGVSMALTQRSEFASVIQRGGGNVSVLIDHLRQQ